MIVLNIEDRAGVEAVSLWGVTGGEICIESLPGEVWSCCCGVLDALC